MLRFSTGPGGAPIVTTGAATAVTASGATLAGTVDAHGAQTAFAFEYGTTNAFGSLSAIDNAGDSNAVQQITLPIGGLAPGTTYLYRIIATNPNGTSFGTVHSLTTAGSAFATGPAQRTIAAGQGHSCVVRTTGQVGCWGTRFRGFFGDGLENGTSVSPVNATALDDAVEIGAGAEHTCALRANGQVYCWGVSRFGQRGDGTLVDSDVPAPVSGVTDAVQLSVGAYSSCAVRATGQVMCWGMNDSGQLGNGTTLPSSEPSLSPTAVVGLTDAVQVSIGRLGACAVRLGGKVSCWGSLGSLNSNVPVEKAGVTDATQVTVGSGGFNASGWALRYGPAAESCAGASARGSVTAARRTLRIVALHPSWGSPMPPRSPRARPTPAYCGLAVRSHAGARTPGASSATAKHRPPFPFHPIHRCRALWSG